MLIADPNDGRARGHIAQQRFQSSWSAYLSYLNTLNISLISCQSHTSALHNDFNHSQFVPFPAISENGKVLLPFAITLGLNDSIVVRRKPCGLSSAFLSTRSSFLPPPARDRAIYQGITRDRPSEDIPVTEQIETHNAVPMSFATFHLISSAPVSFLIVRCQGLTPVPRILIGCLTWS
jgi:hypothetical protein